MNKLGPTKNFSKGKLNNEDEGGIQISVREESGKILIEFGTPVAWVAMPPDVAIAFVEKLEEIAYAIKARRQN